MVKTVCPGLKLLVEVLFVLQQRIFLFAENKNYKEKKG